MAATIPAPANRWLLVHHSAFTVLTVDVGGLRNVVLTDDGLTVTLSVTGWVRAGQREAAVQEHRILGTPVATVDVRCGDSAGMGDVVLHGVTASEVQQVREAIPNLYAGDRELGRRAALRAVWRRLERQALPAVADAGGS